MLVVFGGWGYRPTSLSSFVRHHPSSFIPTIQHKNSFHFSTQTLFLNGCFSKKKKKKKAFYVSPSSLRALCKTSFMTYLIFNHPGYVAIFAFVYFIPETIFTKVQSCTNFMIIYLPFCSTGFEPTSFGNLPNSRRIIQITYSNKQNSNTIYSVYNVFRVVLVERTSRAFLGLSTIYGTVQYS